MERIPAEMKKAVGQRMREARKARGLTTAGVAKAAGISQGNYSDMEGGRKSPSIRTLAALAEALGVSTDWILTGERTEGRNIAKILAGTDSHYNGEWLTPEEREQIDQYIRFLIRQRRPEIRMDEEV